MVEVAKMASPGRLAFLRRFDRILYLISGKCSGRSLDLLGGNPNDKSFTRLPHPRGQTLGEEYKFPFFGDGAHGCHPQGVLRRLGHAIRASDIGTKCGDLLLSEPVPGAEAFPGVESGKGLKRSGCGRDQWKFSTIAGIQCPRRGDPKAFSDLL